MNQKHKKRTLNLHVCPIFAQFQEVQPATSEGANPKPALFLLRSEMSRAPAMLQHALKCVELLMFTIAPAPFSEMLRNHKKLI